MAATGKRFKTEQIDNIERVLHILTQSTSLLAMLMLRGPQTAGELRINCERLHEFADIPLMKSTGPEPAPAMSLTYSTVLAGTGSVMTMELLSGSPLHCSR